MIGQAESMAIEWSTVMSEETTSIKRARALLAESALWAVIAYIEQQTNVLDQIKMGLFEVKDFAEAIQRGGDHPLLAEYRKRKAGTSRPVPSLREQQARHLAVGLCIALQRAGTRKGRARQIAAKALARTRLFAPAPTPAALRHWEERLYPALTADDEKVIEAAMARCGKDPQGLVDYFVGLVRLSRDPFIPARLP
jgi:hypothetical protein